MEFDYLTGSLSDFLHTSGGNSQVQTPTLAASPTSTSWWSGAGDFISTGLDTWLKFEQIQQYKDSGSTGQKEVLNTVQTTNPNSDQTYVNPNANLAQQMAQGLKIGTGTLYGVIGVIGLLWYMNRKK